MKKQLCWDCQNARADRCCWMCDLTPVPGWDAKPVPQRLTNRGYVIDATYAIKACPNFVPDEVEDNAPIKLKTYGAENRVQKVLRSLEKLMSKKQNFLIKGRK